MKVLLTGGSGFIGKALITRLLREGINVSALTRTKSGCPPPRPGVLEIYKGDISDAADLKRSLIPENVDAVVHLAASLDYFGDRRKLFHVNVEGTANLLDWAQYNRVRKFVFISSIEAMGAVPADKIPADETLTPAPLSAYGESKLAAERMVERFSGEKIILRLGNVYGPPSPAFMLPLADAILTQGRLLQLLPHYCERRLHPVYIDDVEDGIIKALDPGAPGGVYIIAGAKHAAVSELFACVAGELGETINPRSGGMRFAGALYLFFYGLLRRLKKRADLLSYFTAGSGKRVHRAYSIEKAVRELGYAPRVDLADGIHRTMEWAKKEGILHARRRE